MQERLRQLGGQLEILSSPRGTTVRALVPTAGRLKNAGPKNGMEQPMDTSG
jgi:signal transduction histidine kinase